MSSNPVAFGRDLAGFPAAQGLFLLTGISGGGFEPGAGPAEYILMAIERYQAAQKALGRLFEIVFSTEISSTSFLVRRTFG
jgi:hypothetical protein